MNRPISLLTFFLCFSALTGLVSCERETPVSPIQPATELPQTVGLDDEILVVASKKYTLVKHGTKTLAYTADGKVKKVTFSPGHYIDYTYEEGEFRRVFTKEYNDNKLDVATTYYIHRAQAAGGQTYEPTPPAGAYYKNYPDQCYLVSTEKYMHYKQGDEVIKTEHLYTYNDKGQLARMDLSNFQGTYYPNKRIDFAYNAAGDLTKATEYNAQNVKIRESTFEYTAFGDPILNDRNAFNPEELQVDPYVTVFGKYSKHLARGKKQEAFAPYSLLSNIYYQYAINGDGYVTKQDTYTLLNAQLILSTPFEYTVTFPRIVQ
ncbi:hypothetical protein [Larkinella humicola]|uniref:DUF4595 domain-containing protein n=1 Tax=Larkinella humicola TaxID=2607654 RepID=A0A5N1JN77_9BACT|nr:hypothetical protein [Larkinella humicola]KAA9354687.1 hypothetical protein F0P93_08765 [Larkinella humicola]